MSKTQLPPSANFKLTDPVQLAQNMTRFFEQAADITRSFAERPDIAKAQADAQVTPVEQVSKTLGALASAYSAEPQKLMDMQTRLWASYTQLWQNAWAKALGSHVDPLATPERSDKRFKDQDWQDNSVFDFIKQAYLIAARWAVEVVDQADGLDEHTRRKAHFYVEQLTNAFSPSNFPLTNPEVLRATLASNGANLLEGLKHFEQDWQKADGRLRITQTDTTAFEVGRNIAMTEGHVVFRNDLFELIQYRPTTEQVYDIPLLIVPPWINKFYILDLNPQKSFVRWATAQGLTVFIMSWVNAGEAQARKSFSDYMREGFLTAVAAVLKATGAEKLNTIGYCIGGTLVASALGYMAARHDDRVNAATFFTTQVDFEKAGDLLVYVDEDQVRWIEQRMQHKGYLPGSRMADAFNLLRSNDLIWSNVVNHYLLGKEATAFDLLYWNSDATCMPAGVHSFYLREFYLQNRLAKGQLVLDGVRIDLKKVTIPIYNLAAREDHIAPLESVFKLAQFFGGPTRLVVSGSGHIAGVINPPEAQKYQYWTNDQQADDWQTWMGSATEHAGSWWPDWLQWLAAHSGKKIAARTPGDGALPVLGPAPGENIRVRSE